MTNRFTQMDCFILAGGAQNPSRDFEPEGELTRLETRFRRFASIFERVRLVLKPSQATERYLNYPHVCDTDETPSPLVGLMTALRNSNSEAVFIGTCEPSEIPLEMIVDLVNRYNNEMYLGYRYGAEGRSMIGICHRKLADQIETGRTSGRRLGDILSENGTVLPWPSAAIAG